MKRPLALPILIAFFAVLVVLIMGWLSGLPEGGEGISAEVDPGPERIVAQPLPPTTPELSRRVAARDAPATTADAPRAVFTLLVVDGESEQPLPGAEVWTAKAEEFRAAMKSEEGSVHPDEERTARELGQRQVTDSAGELHFADTGEVLYASGRAGELWGHTFLRVVAGRAKTLELRRDQRLVIEVVDASGRPCAEVPVALFTIDGRYRDLLWIGQTQGARGVALVPHYQMLVEGCSELYASFGFPLLEEPRVPVKAGTPPAQPVRLILPATGSLLVEVVDEKGQPAAGRLDVKLERVPAVTEAVSDDSPGEPGFWMRCEVGRVLFSHVGLGLELELEAHSDEGYKPVATRALGPQRPGQRALVLLRLGELHPILTGRLLDPEGRPLVNRELYHKLSLKEEHGRRAGPVQTDGLGRFRIVVDSRFSDLGACELSFTLSDDDLELDCALDLPPSLPAGELDLGDLQLAYLPIALAGRIVEEEDRPVSRVGCALWRKRFPDDGSGSYTWTRVKSSNRGTNAQGDFVITGQLEPGEYGLKVDAPNFPNRPPFPVQLGDRHVLIRLVRGGGLAGSVLLDERIPAYHVLLIAQRDTGGGTRQGHVRSLGKDGNFLIEKLWPGRWEVLLYCGSNQTEPLIQPIPVEIVSGETARPPALQEIDLRGMLHLLLLQIVDEEGEPLDGDVVFGPADEIQVPRVEANTREGRVSIVNRWPALDLLVTAPGRRDAWLEGASGELKVVLHPALAVKLQLTGELEFPDENHRLIARLRPAFEGADSWDYVHVHHGFVPSGRPFEGRVRNAEVELLLATPGTWRLEWLIERPGKFGPDWASLPGEASSSLEIRDVDTLQVLEVAAPPQGLIDEAIRRLGE